MCECWKLVAGASSSGTTVETPALGCTDGSAITARPPLECRAPTMKSVWPPKPLYTAPGRSGRREALACANRSTCSAVLMLVIRGCFAMSPGSLVVSVRTTRTAALPSTHS
jgi:hypothetical protein